MQNILKKLNLETKELDKVLANLTDEEVTLLLSVKPIVNILAVSPKTQEILANHPEVIILSKGTNWQAAVINNDIFDELEEAGQFPHFDYYLTIDYFRK